VLSRLLALLLVLAMWPALGETVEMAVHFAEHGDLAHDPVDHPGESPLGSDEHGCSGTFHLCSAGHANMAGPRAVSFTAAAQPRLPAPGMPAPLDERGRDAPVPPIRPPIA
jgi:hypothetical protein